MAMLTLTSKRQATFPVETCDSLGLKPGDSIELEPRTEDGEKVWILRTRTTRNRDWVGCLKSLAKKMADHSLEAVRESITEGRKGTP
jgi:bifunctional DNA-binding transcriptional regulator/antitoxin component of YhaV-PrlF toxin-antitoxin module